MSELRRGIAALVGGSIVLSAVGCTGASPGSPAADPKTQEPAASEPARSDVGSGRQPTAIIVHPSRGTLDLDVATARRIVQGAATNWRALGEAPESITMVATGSPPHKVRVVSRDPAAVAVVPAALLDPRVRAVKVSGIDPLTDPTSYPLQQAAERSYRPLTITVVGDIMMARGVAASMGDDPFAVLERVAPVLRSADLAIGNLESSLSRIGRPTQGDDSFGADPAVLDALERAGIDVLSLANNHVGDFGPKALQQTVQLMNDSDVQAVGAGATIADARRPAVVEVGEVRVGILAFNAIGESPAATSTTPGVVEVKMPPRTGPLDRTDLAAVENSIRRLRGQADIVIVLPHWGDQYTARPLAAQRRVARHLVRAGASVVAGGHPHWVQGIERVHDSAVAYSLGNFVFDMDFSEPTMQGVTLDLTFWNADLMAVTPRPVQISPAFVPRFVGGERGAAIEEQVWSNSYGSYGAGLS